jgi:demethylmenaquinone methyltransferase/2-methoxy-6-polyprenyl-1,4-benzoquinol methylase
LSNPNQTPPYARHLVRLIRPWPDFDFPFMKALRAEAVALLRLTPGARVLDAGCGPGGSFPYLVDAVGTSGEVVGVEISPDVAVNARRRVDRHRWRNVQVVEADVRSVRLEGTFDGLLMFAAPDAYGTREALDNLLPRLRPSARVALFGPKTSRRGSGWILNPLLRSLVPRLSFETTPIPTDEPWAMLAPGLESVEVRELFNGWMFLASGTISKPGPAARTPVVSSDGS